MARCASPKCGGSLTASASDSAASLRPQRVEWISGCGSPGGAGAGNRSDRQQQRTRAKVRNRIVASELIRERRQQAAQKQSDYQANSWAGGQRSLAASVTAG